MLLAGPTGSGKTACFQQVSAAFQAAVVVIEGKEGLLDLDFLGAILPDGLQSQAAAFENTLPAPNRHRWVDGPLLRALRLAQSGPVLLLIDEINRIPRKQINLLLTLLNPKAGDFCRQLGLPVSGAGPYYVIEVPMTSETVACPTANLRIVAAGNFGRAYAVYDLDPALRRRFETVIEFDYLEAGQELALLQRRAGLDQRRADALVKLAQETRRLAGNGELPGCLDTGSLLNWAAKCARGRTGTVAEVMHLAGLTWADLVCGRDHQGRVNAGSFQALADYLLSLDLLPPGDPDNLLAASGGPNED